MASYERDLAYGLAIYGDRLPTVTVSELMTKAVIVCAADHPAAHSPCACKDRDQLVGIISIGDVLKHRLGELQAEADVLRIMP